MVAYCIILAYFLSYAVFKSKGIWTAAYLHALNNQTLSFFVLAVATPTSTIYSFGIGAWCYRGPVAPARSHLEGDRVEKESQND